MANMELDTKLTLSKEVILSPNLAGLFSEDDLVAIGNRVWEGYAVDLQSREKWEKRNQAGMDLALQVQKDKNFPWPGCSNVAFPLITIAALQFHSRAYPTIIQTPNIVRCRVANEDPQGMEKKRADRIGRHMSWQLTEEDKSWEEQHDRLLINLPIVGTTFVKTFHCEHNRSEVVLAQDLVLDYYAKSVETCSRKTHRIKMYRNDIYTGVKQGIYEDCLDSDWFKSPAQRVKTTSEVKDDKRRGQNEPQVNDWDAPFVFLEQHCLMDLDGDGYAEPYIITIEETSRRVMRIVTRFDREGDIVRNEKNEIVRITPQEYFTKYELIPSPDGGIYGVGFGVLLGPLNESVNSILNQLVDAGTMSVTAGGFLGRGAKIRGGQYTFAPLEWKRVDSTGEDLQKSIYPLPVREPSAVLFQLLSLLINFTGRISGTTDTMVGENPGQNTPASTTQAMVEQGMKIYNAVFKRVWRSMKEEFSKLYVLNSIYMPTSQAFGYDGEKALRDDYMGNPDSIAPMADPSISSEAEAVKKAMTLKQLSMNNPAYDKDEVERRVLQALRIENPETVYKGMASVQAPPPPEKIQIEQMRMQQKQLELQAKQKEFLIGLMSEREQVQAQIALMEAQATKALAEAKGVETGQQLAMINSIIATMKARDENMRHRIEIALSAMENENVPSITTPVDGARMAGLGGSPGDQGYLQNLEQLGGGLQEQMGGGSV